MWFSPGFPMQSNKHVRVPHAASRDQIHHWSWLCCDSFFTCETKFTIGVDFAVTLTSLASFCVIFDITSEQLAELKWLILNKTQKMVPFITCEISLCQYLCDLVLGVNVFDLDLGAQIDSIKQPIKSNSVGSGTCLIVKLIHFMIILITASLSSKIHNKASLREDWTFEGINSTLSRSSIISWNFFRVGSLCGLTRTKFVYGSPNTWLLWYVLPWRTATIRSHKSSAGFPSNLDPASKEMIYDSVELCETEVRFLQIQLIGANVWLPKMHNVPPDVDFESSRSLAKSESWNSHNLHCLAVFPTWQYCLYSHVWWV